MKVFIFGAGASLASQGPTPYRDVSSRAPLVDQLFEPQYGNSASDILSDEEFQEARSGVQSAGSLEKWITQRWEQVQSLKEDISKTAERAFFGKICFYIWNLLQRVSDTYDSSNGYNLFAKKLKDRDEPFGLISFNYDTLLDRAAQSRFGVPLTNLDNYFKIRLIKPHGSVNWLLDRRNSDPLVPQRPSFHLAGLLRQASSQIFNGDPLNLNQGIRVLYPDDPDLRDIQNLSGRFGYQYFYPSILLPLTVKQYDFLIGFNDRIISKGKEVLSTASEIYLIGYRAVDDVIKEMFTEVGQGVVLHVVSLGDSKEILGRVLDWHPGKLKEGQVFPTGFWDFIQNY